MANFPFYGDELNTISVTGQCLHKEISMSPLNTEQHNASPEKKVRCTYPFIKLKKKNY